ncbi:phage holin [Aerococcus kribbianus]|uniref:Holin n=1 Tax=Aerococcus kribbianus TaxID=2999064 RepID=A0A9X3FP08_9LACT|nr:MULTISPECIES: phage holin [unclassified Aerococcus]MCZ0717820.1 holin [Aerococcus sp. YH-aer221]MCZ0726107.1 holin [Aerococcus sp. YH-aer222]
MKLNNNYYDAGKWIALILLPALAVLYSTLGEIWGWPNTEQVVPTISAINVFLGAVLQLSNHQYKKEG